MWHCGTLLCGRQRRTSKHREKKVSFDVSCQIIVCFIINMDTKGKRGSNWTIDEEMLLIELSKLKDEELFRKMKGSGDVKASTIRQNAWQAIADILNA